MEGDTVLFLRSLFFYMVADESALVVGGRSVAYLVESPQDPQSYAPAPEENPEKACPSFWCWEEWKSFKEFYQMLELSFDQGPMGHTRRKPTTIGTNIKILEQLSEVRGPGKMRGLQQTLEERLVESKKWAEWAPGFKRALVIALEAHFEDAKMARLTMDQWKAHLGNDHLPFRKECRTCVQAAGRGKMHKRVVHPNAFTLAVDLGGPHVRGVDQGGKAPGKATYMVVGVYTIPVSKLGASLLPPEAPSREREDEELEDGEEAVAAEVVPVVAEDGVVIDPAEVDEAEEWKKKIEKEDDVAVRQLTFVEMVDGRSASKVLQAIAKMYARLRYMGLPVMRLHSDRAAELTSSTLRTWCQERDIYRTFTDGDAWKLNGRAEAEIGYLSRATRVLLTETGLPLDHWPLATRHAAERRLQQQLKGMMMPHQALLPFGSEGYAKVKYWTDRDRRWKRVRVKVKILGPDASMSSGGYYVKSGDGKYFRTSDVRICQDFGEGAPRGDLPELGDAEEARDLVVDYGVPLRRVVGKTTPDALRSVKVLEDEIRHAEKSLQSGVELMMEEAGFKENFRPGEETYDLTDDLIVKNEYLEHRLRSLCAEKTEVEESQCLEAAQWLQTVTVSLADVRKDLDAWRPAISAEYSSLMQTGSVRPISEEEVEKLAAQCQAQGRLFEVVPGKAVATRKSPDGRRKVRGVICGNHMIPRPVDQVYAAGVDVSAVRAVIRWAALQGKSLATVDVATAFLQVPGGGKKDTTVVIPPKLFSEAGCCDSRQRWLMEGTLYGTTTAPREWGDHRDYTLERMRWGSHDQWRLRRTSEPNIWAMEQCVSDQWDGCGFLAVYVDDILIAASESAITEFLPRLTGEWKCSAPEWVKKGTATKFCGLDIEKDAHGDGYRIHQESYVRSVLAKHEVNGVSMLPRVEVPEEEGEPSLEMVRRAQAVTGEVLWVASHTRPELSYASAIMSQFAVKRPAGVVKIGDEVMKYLASNPALGLYYGSEEEISGHGEYDQLPIRRGRKTIEVHCDAAFAAASERSMSGVVVKYAGAPIFWVSVRQSTMALSTAEAELGAQLEGLVAGRSLRALMEVFEGPELQAVLYNDNMAALSISGGTSGSWRTRHLRIKARGLTEAIKSEEWSLRHLDGRYLVADGLTKQLAGKLHERLIKELMLRGGTMEEVRMAQFKRIHAEDHGRLSKALVLIVVAGACIQSASAESLEKESDGDLMKMLVLVTMIAGYVIGECIKRLGRSVVRRFFTEEDIVKVKFVRDEAMEMVKAIPIDEGWDLHSAESVTLEPHTTRLVNTGLALELPKGTYARMVPRKRDAVLGLTAGMIVIHQEYRQELKVLVENHSDQPRRIEVGDKIAQLVIDRVYDGGLRYMDQHGRTESRPGVYDHPYLRALQGVDADHDSNETESRSRSRDGGRRPPWRDGDGDGGTVQRAQRIPQEPMVQVTNRSDGSYSVSEVTGEMVVVPTGAAPSGLRARGGGSSAASAAALGSSAGPHDLRPQAAAEAGAGSGAGPQDLPHGAAVLGSRAGPHDRALPGHGGRRCWRVEGGSVYHTDRQCRTLENSHTVYEILRCSECFGEREWPCGGNMKVLDGTGHRLDAHMEWQNFRVLRCCSRCDRV